ncbi:tRNA pseudouridine(55) synthase TruB [Roseospira visakhapatnamensis]|uniref:tRNA pseudouridine synthase B n=1 Tax=Roseospira visakhapatnamensis TaxID=390880 RepID=A0A7W6R9R6_9PROT|nr:tRNA pseudouridine(55) synthase TruB [Roseospira visakhapatnamensis]MBB4264503.1 tRNA pseudouridine55 synthase [Roseospira visakhapatnamensis]
MGRRRKGKPVHGWLVVDKPQGITSTRVVSRVRRATDAAKVGHGGTLDPLATGILPIALGEATKTVSHVMDGRKVYRLDIRWGEARDTDDAEGRVTETRAHRPTLDEVRAALPAFLGTVSQVPPRFSAIKVDGKRAYDLARADQPVDLSPRLVRIDAIDILTAEAEARADPDRITLLVRSGKGTYMRSLARDLAEALGTCAHMSGLRRLACGPFDESQAISLEKLDAVGHSLDPSELLLSVETALDDIPALALTDAEACRLSLGQSLAVLPVLSRSPVDTGPEGADADTVLRAMAGSRLVAMVRIVGGEIRPVRVMNL